MEDDPNDTKRGAKRAKVESLQDSPTDGVLAANAVAAAASPPTKPRTTLFNIDSSYAYRPRPRAPPDPKRYVNLWKEELSSRGPDKSRNTSTTPPSLSTILDELDLAEHHQKTWERINALQRTIDECEREIDKLRRELDVQTVLPRLLDKDRDYKCHFWAEIMPSHLQHDNELAWTLVRAAKDPSMQPARGDICSDYYSNDADNSDEYIELPVLPSSFQWELWWDVRCPLRDDRQLLLESLDKGLEYDVRILWTEQLANDREMLIKIFEKCPWCLNNADIPEELLVDAELIRAFARSASLRWYREKLTWSEEDHVVCQLFVDVTEDPAPLAELIRQCVDTKNKDKWASEMVKEHLRIYDRSTKHYSRIVNALSKEMACVPWTAYHNHCPLRYRDLPMNLQRSRDFILAFISFDVSVTSEVPRDIRDDVELWQAAVQCAPRYENIQVPSPSPDFPSKLFFLLLLEDATFLTKEDARFCFLPNAAGKDRDIAAKYACLDPHTSGHGLWLGSEIQHAFECDRDFWIELAELHHCHSFAWKWVPKPCQSDPVVIFAWARHAKEIDSTWLLSNEPELLANLLSDRQVLLNCLPPIWSNHWRRREDRQEIWTRIDPTVLDVHLWVELLLRGEQDCFRNHIPVDIQDEPAIVRARLRATMKDREWFVDLFCHNLSLGLQLQHVDLLLKMIQGMNAKRFFESQLYLNLENRILHVPEVALALLSKGWCARHRQFEEAVESAPWSADPAFLQLLAQRHLISAFRGCCPEILRADKALALKVLQFDSGLWNLLDHRVYDDDDEDGDGEERPACPLKYDFDVLMSVLESTPAAILTLIPPLDSQTRRNYLKCSFPTKQIVAFAREVRQRLTLHASIETVMMGTRSREGIRHVSSTSSPLSLLDQDRYTTGDFRERLTALLGAPSVDDGTVASLRRVSNSLTRYGF